MATAEMCDMRVVLYPGTEKTTAYKVKAVWRLETPHRKSFHAKIYDI